VSSSGDNDTLASAQDIDLSAVVLQDKIARLAVAGTAGLGLNGISNDFESGVLPASFTKYSDPFGQVQLTAPAGAGNSSAYALSMNSSLTGTGFNLNVLNEAVQTVDLTGISQPTLTFSHVKFNDSADSLPAIFSGHANGDGVSISNDG